MKHALVLCSGGIDSTTVSYLIKPHYSHLTLIFYAYGQRSCQEERKAVTFFAKELHAGFKEIKLTLKKIAPSLLISRNKVQHELTLHNTKNESKQWYVPQRNLIFFSNALAYAETLPYQTDIFFGFKAEGKESYPDATPAFVHECNVLARITTKGKSSVKAPLITKDKEDIILLGEKLGIEYTKTISCYQPIKKKHCGVCLACRLRKAGFYWAGIRDPTKYVSS